MNNRANKSSRAAMSHKRDMMMDWRRRKTIKGRGERQTVEPGRTHPSAGLSGPEPSLCAGSLVGAAPRLGSNPASCGQQSYRSVIGIVEKPKRVK